MVQKVECHRKHVTFVRNGPRGEAARADVKRRVPSVIDARGLRQADLADDLRPQVERVESVLSGVERFLFGNRRKKLLDILGPFTSLGMELHKELVMKPPEENARPSHQGAGRGRIVMCPPQDVNALRRGC